MGEMRNSFNVEETLQIKKKAKRKVIKWALLMAFILEVILIATTFTGNSRNWILTMVMIGLIQVMVVCIAFLFSWFTYHLIVMRQTEKLNAKLAEVCLSKTEWTQVIPVGANEYQEFMLQKLKAKFFAKLREDGDIIDVYVQLHQEKEYLPLEKISKNWFLNYYSILEESEEEET